MISDLLENWEEIAEYCRTHSSLEPKSARNIRIRTLQHTKHTMLVGEVVGNLLRLLSLLTAPRSVLEIGSFTGYSIATIASCLSNGARAWAIEEDSEAFKILEQNLSLERLLDIVTPVHAEGFDWLARSGHSFDFIFLDARKELYPANLDLILSRVNPSGLLVVDNTLARAGVLAPSRPWEMAIHSFNEILCRDQRFKTVLLPIRDGITIAGRFADG